MFRGLKTAIFLSNRRISHFLHQCLSINILFGDYTRRILDWHFEMVVSTVNFLHHCHHRLLKSPRTHASQGRRCSKSSTWWFEQCTFLRFERLLSIKSHGSERRSLGLKGRFEIGRRALIRLAVVDTITNYYCRSRDLIHIHFCFKISVWRPFIKVLFYLNRCLQHLVRFN